MGASCYIHSHELIIQEIIHLLCKHVFQETSNVSNINMYHNELMIQEYCEHLECKHVFQETSNVSNINMYPNELMIQEYYEYLGILDVHLS